MGDETMEQAADRAAAAGDFAAALNKLEGAVKADSSNFALWMKLSAMRKASGDVRGALAAVERSLAMSPLDFSALLSRAMLLDMLGDPMAGEEFGNALAQAPPEDQVPEPMRAAVARARKRWQLHQASLEAHLLEALPVTLPPSERRRTERLISNRSRRTRHFHSEPRDYHYPGLPEVEFHDRELFPELALLEQATADIRAEFESLVAAEAAEMVPYIQYPDRVPLAQWRELNHNPQWSAMHLLQNGHRIEANARHCPRTMEVVAQMPQPHVRNASPNAMFSLLAPHTRIPPHTGAANTRLVCHLPLIIPADCGFRVGETTREWKAGEAFVFDDTIEHEAWNDSDELRVVFIIDLWAPALSATERDAVAAIMGAAGTTAGV
ncbi:MAG TPA: aspartyl/asparaginyl beta-hydroxylase domain-containing protein [Sphingomicrobium sp.]|nr:aspartyl/asparaginyl beta-hydroxylase domain-containing protein [Sphingomicrobium sp.]